MKLTVSILGNVSKFTISVTEDGSLILPKNYIGTRDFDSKSATGGQLHRL